MRLAYFLDQTYIRYLQFPRNHPCGTTPLIPFPLVRYHTLLQKYKPNRTSKPQPNEHLKYHNMNHNPLQQDLQYDFNRYYDASYGWS